MFDFISSIFKPAANLVDELHVSEEEKGKLRNEFARIQSDIHAKTVELAKAEASSEHFITSSWRPICALILFTLILVDGFGFIKAPPQVYDLAQIFLGVYGGGRSLEKVVKGIKK